MKDPKQYYDPMTGDPKKKQTFDLTELIALSVICSTIVLIVWILFG